MEQLIERAILLINQQRYTEAEQVLNTVIRQAPQEPMAFNLLSEVKLQQNEYEEAEELIDTAISLEPDNGIFFCNKARILVQQKKMDDAEYCLERCAQLEPWFSGAFALWASVKLQRKQYREALNLADHALELDPEDILALNMRSTALTKLDRTEESFATIEGALNEDPNNAYTHSNYGWNLLEKGDHKKALFHFSEALRNNPNLQHAQAGMAEALKAKYAIYRWFLKYSFWIGNLTTKYQWGVILGFYLGTRILRFIAANNKTLQPYLMPLIVLLFVMAFSTWIVRPVGNLFLRLNKFGKHLLSRKEIVSSNFVGVSMLVFLFGSIMYLILLQDPWLAVAVFGFSMMIPLSTLFVPAKNKYVLSTYALALATVGSLAIGISFSTGNLYNTFSIVYLAGIFIFQWVVNFIAIKEDNV